MSINKYLNLITSEHRDKPNFISWLSSGLNLIDDVNIVLNTYDTEFDIDNAIGAQLDILGKIIGVNRIVNFQPSNGVSPVLDDDTYRFVLKAQILSNQWDGTNENLIDLWSTLFPDNPIIINDKQDMTMEIFLFGLNSSIEQDLINNGYIIPQPMGIGITYIFPPDTVFGYNTNNGIIQGYDSGHWYYK